MLNFSVLLYAITTVGVSRCKVFWNQMTCHFCSTNIDRGMPVTIDLLKGQILPQFFTMILQSVVSIAIRFFWGQIDTPFLQYQHRRILWFHRRILAIRIDFLINLDETLIFFALATPYLRILSRRLIFVCVSSFFFFSFIETNNGKAFRKENQH